MNERSQQLTRLNKTDLSAIEARVRIEAGAEPTIDSLISQGHTENRAVITALDWISGAGRVVTLIIAEFIQAGAALAIAVVFALLEYWRVYHGAEQLGQTPDQSALIAFAVVTANVVTPIYALRQMRGQRQQVIQQGTGRGYAGAFWRRLFDKPTTKEVDLYYNPTLSRAAMIITWTTVILAVYDILGPLLAELATGALTRPLAIAGMELVMGLGLSFAGVFFLQSAAHEIGVRTLTDQPQRLTDILAQQQADRAAMIEAIREQVTAEHMAAKLQDIQRQQAAKNTNGHRQEDFFTLPLAGNGNYDTESHPGN